MKKHLSIFFIAIASIIVISSVTSCVTKEDKEDVSINSKYLIGTWEEISVSSPFTGEEIIHGYYLQFKEDGTYIEVDEGWVDMEDNVYVIRGEWSLSGNSLFVSEQITVGEETYPTTFTVSNLTKNSLTLVWAGGIFTTNFKRVSDSIIEKYL